MDRLQQIREDCEEATNSSWHGDYPVEDVQFLIACVDEMLATWRPPPEED